MSVVEYIDRKVVYQFAQDHKVKETGAFSKGYNKGLRDMMAAVMNEDAIPSADVRPVVRGVWLNTTEQNELHDTCVSCSICGDSYVLDDWGIENLKEMFNYCPNCGADMRDQANKVEDAE